jgi:hypothetical protein
MKLTFTRGPEHENTVRFYEQPRRGKNLVLGSILAQRQAAGDAKALVVEIRAFSDVGAVEDAPGGAVGEAMAKANAQVIALATGTEGE